MCVVGCEVFVEYVYMYVIVWLEFEYLKDVFDRGMYVVLVEVCEYIGNFVIYKGVKLWFI